jgi:uncharacterized membrane protein YfcA
MGRPGQPGKENLQQHGVQAKDKKSGPPPWQSFAARSRHGPDNSFRQPRVKQANWRMAGLRVQHGRRCVHARAIHRGQLMIKRVGAHALSRRKMGERRVRASGVGMEAILPADMSLLLFVGLTVASFCTAFIGLYTGTAGGLILLAIMATVMPPASVVPAHTFVQLGSGLTRAMLMWRWIMRGTILPFLVGATLGAMLGARTFVALPQAMLMGILGGFILVVTWLPNLGRLGAERGRFAVVGFAATFLGVFVSATGTLVAPFVASAAPDRRNHAATLGALMTLVHILKLIAFTAIGFSVWDYVPLIIAMVATGSLGNWLGEVALARTSEKRFRIILQIGLTILALRLIWNALAT